MAFGPVTSLNRAELVGAHHCISIKTIGYSGLEKQLKAAFVLGGKNVNVTFC